MYVISSSAPKDISKMQRPRSENNWNKHGTSWGQQALEHEHYQYLSPPKGDFKNHHHSINLNIFVINLKNKVFIQRKPDICGQWINVCHSGFPISLCTLSLIWPLDLQLIINQKKRHAIWGCRITNRDVHVHPSISVMLPCHVCYAVAEYTNVHLWIIMLHDAIYWKNKTEIFVCRSKTMMYSK